jgi:mRNA interferase RelE/StbE
MDIQKSGGLRMRIELTKSAAKYVDKLSKETRQRIMRGILGLTERPPRGDIKPLQGSTTENRLRIGKYRIIYEFILDKQSQILLVNKIDTRGIIYRK